MNPFVYGRVVSKKEFCPRPQLEARLKSHILSHQNVLVEGERRTGKTSLICETIRKIKNNSLLYVDLLEIKDVDELCRRMIKALVSMSQKENIFQMVLKNLAHIKPVISIDTLTGLPTVSIGMDSRLPPNSIEEILDLVDKQKGSKNIVIVFDEFQDILNLDDHKSILGILRSKIQFMKDITFIFSGSIRNTMNSLFSDPESPFFKSAITIEVGEIEKNHFETFLHEKMAHGKRRVQKEIFQKISEICQTTSGDMQQFCAALWDCTDEGDDIGESYIPKALQLIFSMERKGYEAHLGRISSQQKRCLIGLAKQGGKLVLGAAFLKYTGINQPASIKKAVGRLIDLKIIYSINNEYKFTNPFFKAWLASEY
jgi:uncharacterized protein